MTRGNIYIKGIGLVLLIVLLLFYVEYFSNPFKKIQSQSSEDGSYYLEIYKFFYSKEGFDSLATRLILENNDAISLNATVAYIEKNGMCTMLPVINMKCLYFDKFPNDTVWVTQLSNRKRESSKRMLYFPNGIFSCRERLSITCK